MSTDPQEAPQPARAAQDGTPPVAVIAWLPDIVSNGTWWTLDGRGSYDPDGEIVGYNWRIIVNNQTTYETASSLGVKFSTLGLYRIYLTVTDDEGHTDDAFWAVFSIKDADDDSLPDWWEDKYWPTKIHGLDYQTAGSDPDGDGYSNLEEYSALTDPTDPSSHPLSFWEEYWLYIVILVALVAAVIGVSVPLLVRRHRELEKKKIEYAIEIDKELSKELESEEDEKKPG